ncbi:MAG: hypothetical protein H0Z28_02630 [Archaeoglobus sp.]|nr:hypothetical protein [Archaeoglobus sp.]
MGRIEKLLGIVGGIVGVLIGFFTLLIGAVGTIIFAPGGLFLVLFGIVTVIFGILGIIGGIIVDKNNKAASALMLLGGVGGFITTHILWIIPGVLLIGSSFLVFRGR